ncbi:hypothetical protein BCR42DRAFT_101525 [Absidia repens]|uniref:Uncharacterized protein n=1 Tax=Absidia repens TaxID=90262 RepID=A0A1X2I8T1_9FUNG|nr:hypothetical protein BCR42DRAFT_101525 [Absidia repens]
MVKITFALLLFVTVGFAAPPGDSNGSDGSLSPATGDSKGPVGSSSPSPGGSKGPVGSSSPSPGGSKGSVGSSMPSREHYKDQDTYNAALRKYVENAFKPKAGDSNGSVGSSTPSPGGSKGPDGLSSPPQGGSKGPVRSSPPRPDCVKRPDGKRRPLLHILYCLSHGRLPPVNPPPPRKERPYGGLPWKPPPLPCSPYNCNDSCIDGVCRKKIPGKECVAEGQIWDGSQSCCAPMANPHKKGDPCKFHSGGCDNDQTCKDRYGSPHYACSKSKGWCIQLAS